MEDISEAKKEFEQYPYTILHISEVPEFLKKLNFPQELIDILMKDEIKKLHPVRKTTPSMLRAKYGQPSNIQLYWTNCIQHSIKNNLSSLADYVFLQDTTETMI